MELKKGYKQTELGVIPEEWSVIPIGKIFEFKNGLNKAKWYFGKGTPIVNYMDVFNNPGIFEQDVEGKVTLTTDEIRNYQVKQGDVFFTRTSETVDEIGMSSVLLENITDAVFSGFVLRGRPKNDILDLLYKQYCFRSKEVRKQICSTSSYTTRALTNGKLLSNVYIAVPSTKAEQTAIATALSDADALIQSMEKLIAKKRHIKQGVMQKLLKPKDGWLVKKLGEVGKCLRGVSYSGEKDLFAHDTNDSIRLFRSNNIQKSNIIYSDIQYVYDVRVKSTQKMKTSDILICMANGSKALVGKAAKFKQLDSFKYTFGAFMGCFRATSNEADSNYIFYNFLSYNYRSCIELLLSGSSINNLKPSDIESIEIPFPNKKIQTRIATILSDMDAEISALETKLAKYKQVKQGMMQNLLTGKIRLV